MADVAAALVVVVVYAPGKEGEQQVPALVGIIEAGCRLPTDAL